MRKIILARHSNPEIIKTKSAHVWHLSDKGKRNALRLAQSLERFELHRIFTSDEPKAVETGEIIANHLKLPVRSFPNLHEQERYNVGWFASPEERADAMQPLFEHRDAVVFGEESANDALKRFNGAMTKILKRHAKENIVIVNHGTVTALYLDKHVGINAYEYWEQQSIPMYVVLTQADDGSFILDEIVHDMST